MQMISAAIDAETPGLQKPTVLDYFLGKRDREDDEEFNRSYKAASPEELCIIRAQKFWIRTSITDGLNDVATSLSTAVTAVKDEAEQRIVGLFTATSTQALDPDRRLTPLNVAKYCVGHYYDHYEDYIF
jgi:hypothetical protein